MLKHKSVSKYNLYITYLGTVAAIVFLVHVVFLNMALGIELNFALLDSAVFNLLFIVLASVIYFPAKYITFTGDNFLRVFFSHLAASIFASALWYLSAYLILIYLFDLSEYKTFLITAAPWRILIGLLYYFVVAAVNYGIIYYKSFQEKLKNEIALNNYAREAELKSLKYQINPHFIFNSLNSIASLTTFEPTMAREMTVKLSTYLRSTLATGEKTMCLLEDEIRNARLYIEIEKVRFGDKIELIEKIDPSALSLTVPSLFLQPLLENAVKYGVYESLEKVVIKLECEIKNQYLVVSVENNYDTDSKALQGEKIGLNNIRNRLDLLYNQDNLLTVDNTGNVFRVNVYIPLGDKE